VTNLVQNKKTLVLRKTLRKHEIIHGRKEIQKTFELGFKKSGNFITLFYLKGKTRKVGFIVSKKYKKAVDRNRAKRRMKEIYRTNKECFSFGIWLIYYKYFETIPAYKDMKNDILQIVQKIKGND